MKSRRKPIAVLLCALIILPLILTTVLLGCSCSPEEPPADTATPVSISLDTSGAKTSFAYGETFTTEGLKVTAAMSDGTNKDVPLSDCTFSSPNMTAPGTRSVTVTYQEKTARYEITVAEKYMPAIDSTSLVDITGVNEDVGYRVEAEDINMAVSGAVTESGSSFIETAVDTTLITSGGKYLGNFGVAGNYFGFTFTADKDYNDIILVLRMAYGGTTNLNLGTSMKIYLNYKSMSETGEVDIDSKTIEVGETADECGWQDIVVRGISVSEGSNALTFEILNAKVPNIDYIDFYVGKRYISSVVEVSEVTTYIKEFEDFDLERIVNREDMIAAHGLQPGQCYLERATTNLAGTSKGTSAAGFTTGTEISTTIRTAQDATVKIIMAAAQVDSYKIKDAWEFYIDGELLTEVEDKDIKAGSPTGSMYWEWRDTSLGKYDLAAGDHLFTAKVTGGHCNVDIFKFEVTSYGAFAVESPLKSIAVTTVPTKTVYAVGDSFVTSGMVVTATYDDESTEAVTGYTVSPSGTLSASDTFVTISYTKGGITKTTTQSITVTDEPIADVTITEVKRYIFEAEDFDTSGTKGRTDFQIPDGSVKLASPSNASNGQSIEGFETGSVFAISIKAEEDCTMEVILRLSDYDGGAASGYAALTLDETVLTSTAVLASGAGGTNDLERYYNWCDASYGMINVSAGEHTLAITVTNHPNFDCLYFDVTHYGEFAPEPDITISEVKTYVMEAEDCDLSDCVPQEQGGSIKTEYPGNASGGASIGSIGAGSIITVSIKTDEKASVKIYASMAKAEGGLASQYAAFTFGGTAIDLGEQALTTGNSSGGDETMYFNWTDIYCGEFEIEAGTYDFVFTTPSGAVNLDCFKFDVTAYGEPAPEPAVADIIITEINEYVMEAEDCDLSTCVLQDKWDHIAIEVPATVEPATSGGKSIGALGAGSVITVTISTDANTTVAIYARMAKYEGGVASQYASFTFDGEAIDLAGATINEATESNQWYNWTDIYCGTYNITAGEYEFVFTGAINLDCFKFVVTAYGG